MKSFKEKVESELSRSDNFKKVVEAIKGVKGRKTLIISHDDPDGLTSGLILKESAQKIGASEVSVEFPSTFVLEAGQAEEFAKKYNPDIVFVSDKGTFELYDKYLETFPELVVVDHHFTDSIPKKAVYFNPSLEKQPYCSASYITNMIAEAVGARSEYTDLLALIGMKGDFVVEPATGVVSDYVTEYYAEVQAEFPFLFSTIKDVTMFDVEQQEKTAVLSKFSEIIHATCGGGFQYFYNARSEETKDLFPPAFVASSLENIKTTIDKFKKATDVEQLIDCMGEPRKIRLLYGFFKEDWNKVMNLLDTLVNVVQFGKTNVYMFTGDHIPLLPMIGSIKIFDIIKRDKAENGVIISVNNTDEGVHFSFRQTGMDIHLGKIANNLSIRIKKDYGDSINVSGGGHPKAAECKVMTKEVPFLDALDTFIRQMLDLRAIAKSGDKEKGAAEGLDYM